MRGFLGGVSFGALAAAAGAALLSLSMPLPQRVSVDDNTPSAAVDPLPQSDPSLTLRPRDADLVEAAPSAPETAPAADSLNEVASDDRAPAARPEVGAVAGLAPDPQAEPAPQIDSDDPVSQTPPTAAEAPVLPGEEAEIIVSDAPAQPVAKPDEGAEVQAEATAEDEGAAVESAAAEALEETHSSTDPLVSAPEVSLGAPVLTPPVESEAPSALPQILAPPTRQDTPGEKPEETAVASAEPAEIVPGIGKVVVPLTERDTATASTGTETSGTVPSVSPALLSPFEAFSEPFDNAEGRPLMSIVLIDDAESIGAEGLAEFPYPLTFAIDPNTADATQKMAARRAAGFEVMVLANLPRDAAPQDAETALPVWFSTLPEAIGILEGTETGVQGNRALAEQVAAVAADGGHGLLMQNSGLNTVQKLALRDGVPSGLVFRDFDGAGQNPRAVRRFLDQAAFRAGQEGAVIMLGRVRPDTISALLLWGLQDRADKVALAPVSASLKAHLPDAQ